MRTISLLVVVEFLGDMPRQQFEIGFADQVLRAGDTDAVGCNLVGDDEAAVNVLDPKVIGQPVNQGLQRQALVGGRARGFEFGDVVIGDHTAAAGHRLAAHLNEPAVRQLGHPDDRIAAEMVRDAKREIVVGGRRPGSGGDAKLNDLTQRDARTDLLGRKPVDLREAAIAQDYSILGVEAANALRDRVEDGLLALRLRLQLDDCGVAIIHDGVAGLGRQLCERGQAVRVGRLRSPLDWNCAQLPSLRFSDRGSR